MCMIRSIPFLQNTNVPTKYAIVLPKHFSIASYVIVIPPSDHSKIDIYQPNLIKANLVKEQLIVKSFRMMMILQLRTAVLFYWLMWTNCWINCQGLLILPWMMVATQIVKIIIPFLKLRICT